MSGFNSKAEMLLSQGYWPIMIKEKDKAPQTLPGNSNWRKYRFSVKDIDYIKSQACYSGCGAGIITGIENEDGWVVTAVDIDITDETKSALLVKWCKDNIGPAPERYGNRPKCLLVYKHKGELKKSTSGSSELGKIEYLVTGQQFVAYGIHAKTGNEYEWTVPLCSVDNLVEITKEHIDNLNSFWYKLEPSALQDEKIRVLADGTSVYVGKSIPELVKDIFEGNNLHDSILMLSQQWHYDGISHDVIIRDLKSYMNMSKAKQDRPDDWASRMDDIERMTDGSKDKEPEVDLSGIDIDENEYFKPLPKPPGMYGQLCDDIYKMATHSYEEVAFVTATGMLTGMFGRKFNVHGLGLNMYLTLVADTGAGKDSIERIVGSIYQDLNKNLAHLPSFLGCGSHTGPKSLAESLLAARCQVCIFGEAGFLMKTKTGNQDGLTRWVLKLYTRSAKGNFVKSEGYSDKGIPDLISPCLSIISESTPDILFEAFSSRDSIVTGELPRQSVFRVVGKKPKMNYGHSLNKVRPEIMSKLEILFKKCSQDQSSNDPVTFEIVPCDDKMVQDWIEYEEYLSDITNNHPNPNVQKMSSRAWVKAVKYAAVATVVNKDSVKMQWDEWNWAKSMVDYELSIVESMFSSGSILDDLVPIVATAIVRIMKNGYKDPKLRMCKDGSISKYVLSRALKGNVKINKVSDDEKIKSNPVTGVEKVLNYMVKQGYLIDLCGVSSRYSQITNSSPAKGSQYRITQRFLDLYDKGGRK